MAYAGRWYHFRAMGVVRIRTLALFAATLLLVGACSREQDPVSPAATLGAAPTDEVSAASEAASDSEPADPYAIPADPADIDKEYVERVLNQLTRPISSAARVIVRSNNVTAAARKELATTHRGEALKGVVDAFRAAIRGRPARKVFSARATPIEITVDEVVSATSSCIFVRALQDTSGLAGQEIDPFPGYYHLQLKSDSDDPAGNNPTPWMIVADAEPLRGGEEYADPCD